MLAGVTKLTVFLTTTRIYPKKTSGCVLYYELLRLQNKQDCCQGYCTDIYLTCGPLKILPSFKNACHNLCSFQGKVPLLGFFPQILWSFCHCTHDFEYFYIFWQSVVLVNLSLFLEMPFL